MAILVVAHQLQGQKADRPAREFRAPIGSFYKQFDIVTYSIEWISNIPRSSA